MIIIIITIIKIIVMIIIIHNRVQSWSTLVQVMYILEKLNTFWNSLSYQQYLLYILINDYILLIRYILICFMLQNKKVCMYGQRQCEPLETENSPREIFLVDPSDTKIQPTDICLQET